MNYLKSWFGGEEEIEAEDPTPQGEKELFPERQLEEVYPEDYKLVCRNAFQTVDELIEEPLEAPTWEIVTTLSNVKLYRRTVPISEHLDNPNIYCLRAVGEYDYHPKIVVKYIWDRDRRTEWDDYSDKFNTIEKVEMDDPHIKDCQIYYQTFRSPWPLWHRDFCLLRAFRVVGNEVTTTCLSTAHPQLPVNDSYVRGKVHIDGFKMSLLDNGKCRIRYVAQVDPRGSIPTFLINLASRQIPLTIAKINDNIKKLEEKGEIPGAD